jgi:hypothetical protein
MFLRVFQSLEIGSPNPRITDAHLRGYDRCQPGWIAGRIGCLVAAIDGHHGAGHLVDECG